MRIRVTSPPASVTTETARFCDVLPLKVVALAGATSASQAHRLTTMRWVIGIACLIALVIGGVLLVEAPEVTRLPPGGRSILYIGIVLAWGFVGVGAYAWVRRPENRTGALMVLVGVLMALTGLQFFDAPWLFAIGELTDTFAASALIHLLLAFPSGEVEGRLARRAVGCGYPAGALQLPMLLFMPCDTDCPGKNDFLIADNHALHTLFSGLQQFAVLLAIVGGVIVLLRRWRTSSRVQRRGLEPVLLLGAVILVLGAAQAASGGDKP